MTITAEELDTAATPSGARKAKAEGSLIVGGRYKLAAGQTYTRVTNVTSILSDKYLIERWNEARLARGVAGSDSIRALIVGTPDEDRKQLEDHIAKAKTLGGADEGRDLGSAHHTIFERHDLGERFPMPDSIRVDVDAYQSMLDTHGLVIDANYIEGVIVIEDLGLAGTFDRLVMRDGRWYVADLKTGKRLYYGETSQQLALYAHADYIFDPVTGEKVPMPDVDKDVAYVFHLRPGSGVCELHELDIATGWENVRLMEEVRQARKGFDRLGKIVQPGEGASATPTAAPTKGSAPTVEHAAPPAGEHPNDALRDRFNLLALTGGKETVAFIQYNWPEKVDLFKFGGPKDDAERALLVELADKAEGIVPVDPATEMPPSPYVVPSVADVRVTNIERERPDEGGSVDLGHLKALNLEFTKQHKAVRTQMTTWQQEATRAGWAYHMKDCPRVRRFEIVRAAIRLGNLLLLDGFTEGHARGLVAFAMGSDDPHMPSIPLGACLGAMSLDEAKALIELAETYGQYPVRRREADGAHVVGEAA